MRSFFLAAAILAGAAAGATAQDDESSVTLGGIVESRFFHTGDERSWLEGGLGKTRYGALEDDRATGASLSQATLLVDAEVGLLFSAHVHANLDTEVDDIGRRGRVGIVEAFAAYKPDPAPWLRVRTKAGVFFPPISLEHRGEAWTTTYTLTPSALNAWIGEEVRATGAEARFVLVARDHEISLVGSAFGNNDPAGTLLHWRGWALHDRQTMAGEQLPLPSISSIGPGGLFGRQARWVAPIRELDGKLGWYAGASWRQGGRFEVSALRWDNRGDPSAFDGFQYGWYTEFDTAALRLQLPLGLEVLGQYMKGETAMGQAPDGVIMAQSEFQTGYAMVSGGWDRVRLSVRYDEFEVEDVDPNQVVDDNDEDGHAWTAALVIDVAARHQLFLEWLRVESTRPFRADIGADPFAREDLVQLAFRFRF